MLVRPGDKSRIKESGQEVTAQRYRLREGDCRPYTETTVGVSAFRLQDEAVDGSALLILAIHEDMSARSQWLSLEARPTSTTAIT